MGRGGSEDMRKHVLCLECSRDVIFNSTRNMFIWYGNTHVYIYICVYICVCVYLFNRLYIYVFIHLLIYCLLLMCAYIIIYIYTGMYIYVGTCTGNMDMRQH
jgi:hypothetical protein